MIELMRAPLQTKVTPDSLFISPLMGILQRKCACGQHTVAGGECETCRKKREGMLQRAAASTAPVNGVPPSVHEVLRSAGQPLDPVTRAFMEPRFGHDFSHVRLHTDSKAAESARAVNALAYTVGRDVVFGARQYAPYTDDGRRLVAHELTHVVQQQNGNRLGIQARAVVDEQHQTEQEAESVARSILSGSGQPQITQRIGSQMIQRHKDDLVAYSGGQSGALRVVEAGKLIYTAPAVSGHPGHGENEPSEGPIPTGTYTLHPGITRPTVAKLQGGTCGAGGIGSGYQEITSADPSPCSGAHYCNVPCSAPGNPSQTCFTPMDCWGPKRIKIEGSQVVTTPAGKKFKRDGFFIHGGNPMDAVSSGCVKSLDNSVFEHIRKLTGVKGAVPFCVGSSCPPSLDKAVTEAVMDAVESVAESISEMFGL
jgi:Domain of unknown function (DUF4157)